MWRRVMEESPSLFSVLLVAFVIIVCWCMCLCAKEVWYDMIWYDSEGGREGRRIEGPLSVLSSVCCNACVHFCCTWMYRRMRVSVCLWVVYLCGCMEALASSGMWNILTTVPLTWVIASVFYFLPFPFRTHTERQGRWPSCSFLASFLPSVPQRRRIAYLSSWRSWINNNIPLYHDSQTTTSIQPGTQKKRFTKHMV